MAAAASHEPSQLRVRPPARSRPGLPAASATDAMKRRQFLATGSLALAGLQTGVAGDRGRLHRHRL